VATRELKLNEKEYIELLHLLDEVVLLRRPITGDGFVMKRNRWKFHADENVIEKVYERLLFRTKKRPTTRKQVAA
jgi:hypothetical protein